MTKNGYTVGLYTLGCKVSQYETEAIAEAFEKLGFTRLDFSDTCDVYVINTCTVTAEAGRKCRQVIRRAVSENPHAAVMVTGCHSQTNPEEILEIAGVSYIGGTADKLAIPKKAVELLENRPSAPVYSVTPLDGEKFEDMKVSTPPRTRAYVKIEDGCECRCSYCAIPDARGPVRSKEKDKVLREIEYLASKGVREVVLTGIEIASYGRDLGDGYRLIDLLEEIEKRNPQTRIRLGSLTPELLKNDFIERIAKLKCITPHFHISMQSGCDKTLAAMRRRYNIKMAEASLSALRNAIEGVTFTCDIIVGFPDETEEDFLTTCDFVRRTRFLDMHIFAYSKRKNTPAASYKNQIPDAEKKTRSQRLHAIQREITQSVLDSATKIGRPLSVLFETYRDGIWTGHSDSYIEVCVKDERDLHAQLLDVIPKKAKDGKIWGELTIEN